MAETRPAYTPTTVEIYIRAWVRLVVSAYDGGGHTVDVIYKNQYGPRPDKPYLALQVISVTPNGEPIKVVTNVVGSGGDYESTLHQHYTGTVQIEAYGLNARTLMNALVNTINRDDVVELNMTNRMYVQRAESVTDITIDLDTSFEQRTQCDFRIAFSERVDYESQGVESIEATMNVTGDDDTLTSTATAP